MDEPILQPKITKEFLEEVLGHPINSFTIETGSNPGDNYMSNMFGITISKGLNPKVEEYLIAKCFPNHPARKDFLEKTNIFSKEIDVYTKWIPHLQKFQEELLKKDLLELPFARFISGTAIDYDDSDGVSKDSAESIKMENYLIFEDLRKTSQYKMADRIKGLDVHHCELVMKELAKIHALSWAYKQHNKISFLSEEYAFLKDTMFSSKMDVDFESMQEPVVNHSLTQILKGFSENAKEYLAAKTYLKRNLMILGNMFVNPNGIDEELVENELRVKPAVFEKLNKEPWLFACHGDSWVNNFLFKYDEKTGKPMQMKIVDLQMMREACPTTDLAYFFYSSTVAGVRKQHLDHLLQMYHDEFIRYCKMLDKVLPPGFDCKTLKRRFQRAKLFGFYMGIFLLQIVLVPPEQAKNLDHEEGGKQIADVMSSIMLTESSNSNTNLQGRLKEIVQELYDEGVI